MSKSRGLQLDRIDDHQGASPPGLHVGSLHRPVGPADIIFADHVLDFGTDGDMPECQMPLRGALILGAIEMGENLRPLPISVWMAGQSGKVQEIAKQHPVEREVAVMQLRMCNEVHDAVQRRRAFQLCRCESESLATGIDNLWFQPALATAEEPGVKLDRVGFAGADERREVGVACGVVLFFRQTKPMLQAARDAGVERGLRDQKVEIRHEAPCALVRAIIEQKCSAFQDRGNDIDRIEVLRQVGEAFQHLGVSLRVGLVDLREKISRIVGYLRANADALDALVNAGKYQVGAGERDDLLPRFWRLKLAFQMPEIGW